MSVKNPYSICTFSVHTNHKAIFCDICQFWTHLKCTSLSSAEYYALSNSPEDWFCPPCIADLFPFNRLDVTDFYFALYDFNSCIDSELLKFKCFNPFLDDPDSCHLLLNSNINPNLNVFANNACLKSQNEKPFHFRLSSDSHLQIM